MGSAKQMRFYSPDYASPVTKSAEGLSSAVTVLHTVTAGKSLYLKSAFIGSGSDGIQLYVTDSADNLQYFILAGSGCGALDLKGHPPIQAGYMIKAVASSSSAWNCAGIFGAEE